MKALIVCLLATGCSEQGANLVLSASGGPANASSYEIVLASSDLVPVIGNQRVSPTAFEAETVTYYLQRTAANASGSIDKVDGFRVLVEPNPQVAETTFIPFVLLYDADHQLVGVGTYEADATGAPSPIMVKRGEVNEYPIAVEALAEVVDTKPVSAGDAMQVTCGRSDQTTFRSGVVWRDAAGAELRLLLPDGDGDDATTRALDLDCDGSAVAVAASSEDCDDTRARFHAGASEVCNGEDTSCSGVPYLVVACSPTGMSGACVAPNTGVAICDQATQMTGACSVANECVCAMAPTDSGCRHCTLTFSHGTTSQNVTPCQPAIDATLGLNGLCSGGGTCTIAVLGTRDGWTAKVAATAQTAFGQSASGVTSSFALRVSRPDGAIPGGPGALVGAVDFALTQQGQPPKLFGYELELADSTTTCTGGGPYTMVCTP
ncbi:MAG: putative metal-binding motif-containing protein [Deltaproteobacteria bacterium]